MPVYIFNSKREFWNPYTREFQKEPSVIRSTTEAQIEIRMAGKKDPTSDMLSFEDQFRDVAWDRIMTMKFTKARLKALKEMNSCLR